MNNGVNLIITKATICKNVEFLIYIIEKADIKPGDKVAIAYWSTPFVYNFVKRLYPDADVYFIDEWGVPAGHIDSAKIFRTNVNNKEYWPNMKFDKVIMNPPYGKTLPLDILTKVFESVDFGNGGKVVCLQPDYLDERITWDKNKPFSKYRSILEPRLSNVTEADNLFDMQTDHLLIITEYTKKGGFDYDSRSFTDKKIFDKTVKKILDYTQTSLKEAFNQHKDKYYLAFPAMHGGNGRTYWDEVCVKDYNIAITKETTTSNKYYETQGISFETEVERRNFFNSLFTTFYRYWIIQVKTQKTFNYAQYLPYMHDYTKPWTNQRFCEYFGITGFISDTEAEPGSEWETIINTMKEYE